MENVADACRADYEGACGVWERHGYDEDEHAELVGGMWYCHECGLKARKEQESGPTSAAGAGGEKSSE